MGWKIVLILGKLRWGRRNRGRRKRLNTEDTERARRSKGERIGWELNCNEIRLHASDVAAAAQAGSGELPKHFDGMEGERWRRILWHK